MIPIELSGGVKGFQQVTRFEADRLAMDAGATQCRESGDFRFYFIEDRLEVGHWHALMRVWHPIVREWDASLFDQMDFVYPLYPLYPY